MACLLGVSCQKQTPKTSDVPETSSPAPAAATVPVSHLPETISFNEHVQPILSEYCYHCHGPDSGTREPKDAPLRLDIEKDAFTPRENGLPVIIKGKPADSDLVKRMHEKDPELIMPPPNSHKELGPEQIAILEKWIAQGAPYEAHWAFIPVKRPELPEAGKETAANPIDRFVAEKLEPTGLSSSPPEDLRRFYRRLHLDLTGLPPSPEAVDAFEKSAIVNLQSAIESASDSLLATPASAEHFARHWLDAALKLNLTLTLTL